MIRSFIFDLDGTLFDRDATVAAVLASQVRAFSDVIGPARAGEFIQRVTTLDEHGHRDKDEVYAIVGAEFGFTPPLVQKLVASFWVEYPRHCCLGVDVASTLIELRRRGLRLGIVSNGTTAVQNAAIDALGLRDLIDAILVSQTEGIRKPDPEIFLRAARRVGVAPEECCFVGDHPVVDIEGARAAGFQVFWKYTSYWPPISPLPQIQSLSDLLAFA